MKLRSVLMMALQNHIARGKRSGTPAAKLFGVAQTRIADLMRGKINLLALDTLVNMDAVAGMGVEMRLCNVA